jgi:hypothetical protein
MDDPFAKARAAFEAHMARHQAAIERAMAHHERALDSVARRVAEAMNVRERSTEAMIRRLAARRAGEGPGKPPRGRRPRDEGGEAAPVFPRPKPTPLAGGAEAPIDGPRSAQGRAPSAAKPRIKASNSARSGLPS